jgi:DNA-3-methyladenine glycosylase II
LSKGVVFASRKTNALTSNRSLLKPAYIKHFAIDPKLLSIIDAKSPINISKRPNVFIHLCSSIMSQQLSTAVARVIFKRFLQLYGGAEPTPVQVLDTPFDTLRGIGLSNAKTRYVQNVARFAIGEGMDDEKLDKMSNEEITDYLTKIKGVGKWTTEMLLMFTLGREDVFAIDDLGIQQAMIKLYKLKTDDKKKLKARMLKISEKWSPYRSYACMHLWQWKDIKPDIAKETAPAK